MRPTKFQFIWLMVFRGEDDRLANMATTETWLEASMEQLL
jgi:hypothetical protein